VNFGKLLLVFVSDKQDFLEQLRVYWRLSEKRPVEEHVVGKLNG